jgi:pimeloyl-ACP methyl ester carboxylesterase
VFSALLLGLLVFLSSCAGPSAGPTERNIDIGTHKLHVYCAGHGTPTIVIDTGITETYESWMPLIGKLSAETRVVAYERAGYGRSEPGPLPRDGRRIAEELHALLHKAGIEGPYILLGHSLGGLNMQLFADLYPKEVAGAVLLDPPPLDWLTGKSFPELRKMFFEQTSQFTAAAGEARHSSDPEAKKRAGFFEMLASESAAMMDTSAGQAEAIGSFGDLPLVVIAATRPNPLFGEPAEAYQRFWIEQSEKVAEKSSRGRFVRAEGSGHHIHLDAPQIVLDAVREMLKALRRK